MSKSVATVARRNFLRAQEEETLTGIRLKREPIYIWIPSVPETKELKTFQCVYAR